MLSSAELYTIHAFAPLAIIDPAYHFVPLPDVSHIEEVEEKVEKRAKILKDHFNSLDTEGKLGFLLQLFAGTEQTFNQYSQLIAPSNLLEIAQATRMRLAEERRLQEIARQEAQEEKMRQRVSLTTSSSHKQEPIKSKIAEINQKLRDTLAKSESKIEQAKSQELQYLLANLDNFPPLDQPPEFFHYLTVERLVNFYQENIILNAEGKAVSDALWNVFFTVFIHSCLPPEKETSAHATKIQDYLCHRLKMLTSQQRYALAQALDCQPRSRTLLTTLGLEGALLPYEEVHKKDVMHLFLNKALTTADITLLRMVLNEKKRLGQGTFSDVENKIYGNLLQRNLVVAKIELITLLIPFFTAYLRQGQQKKLEYLITSQSLAQSTLLNKMEETITISWKSFTPLIKAITSATRHHVTASLTKKYFDTIKQNMVKFSSHIYKELINLEQHLKTIANKDLISTMKKTKEQLERQRDKLNRESIVLNEYYENEINSFIHTTMTDILGYELALMPLAFVPFQRTLSPQQLERGKVYLTPATRLGQPAPDFLSYWFIHPSSDKCFCGNLLSEKLPKNFPLNFRTLEEIQPHATELFTLIAHQEGVSLSPAKARLDPLESFAYQRYLVTRFQAHVSSNQPFKVNWNIPCFTWKEHLITPLAHFMLTHQHGFILQSQSETENPYQHRLRAFAAELSQIAEGFLRDAEPQPSNPNDLVIQLSLKPRAEGIGFVSRQLAPLPWSQLFGASPPHEELQHGLPIFALEDTVKELTGNLLQSVLNTNNPDLIYSVLTTFNVVLTPEELHPQNDDYGSLLHKAIFCAHKELYCLLLEQGASLSVKDRFGNTPGGLLIRLLYASFEVDKKLHRKLYLLWENMRSYLYTQHRAYA